MSRLGIGLTADVRVGGTRLTPGPLESGEKVRPMVSGLLFKNV